MIYDIMTYDVMTYTIMTCSRNIKQKSHGWDTLTFFISFSCAQLNFLYLTEQYHTQIF